MASKNKKETDGEYVLKLVLYLLVSSFWVRIIHIDTLSSIPIPAGLFVALLFASREHFQIDRKIEYAIILVGVLVGFWFNTGLVIAF